MSVVYIPPPPLSNNSMADLLCTIMILCRGRSPNGQSIWAYMCIKPSMAKAFKEAREKGAFDISDYGSVIESGEGAEPPDEVKLRMEREYGMNHRYEDDLLNALEVLKNQHVL